jgi:hypothetical protein
VLLDDVADLRAINRAERGLRGAGRTRKGSRVTFQA